MTPLEVISLGGLLPGTLDLAATSTLLGIQGVPVERLLQTIASGALGPSAFQGRKRTATAGLFFHFFIAFTATSLYYVSTRKITALLDYPLLSGILYGVAVHLVMSRVVVALSAVPKRRILSQGLPHSTDHSHRVHWPANRTSRGPFFEIGRPYPRSTSQRSTSASDSTLTYCPPHPAASVPLIKNACRNPAAFAAPTSEQRSPTRTLSLNSTPNSRAPRRSIPVPGFLSSCSCLYLPTPCSG